MLVASEQTKVSIREIRIKYALSIIPDLSLNEIPENEEEFNKFDIEILLPQLKQNKELILFHTKQTNSKSLEKEVEVPLKEALHKFIRRMGHEREGTEKTPSRFLKMFYDFLEGDKTSLDDIIKPDSLFLNPEYEGLKEGEKAEDRLIIIKGINFVSICEHHLLPFQGEVSIGVIPSSKILGASKFSRIVKMYSKRLQLQERLGMNIAEAIIKAIEPKALIILISAIHNCYSTRGVNQKDKQFITVEKYSSPEVSIDLKSFVNEFYQIYNK